MSDPADDKAFKVRIDGGEVIDVVIPSGLYVRAVMVAIGLLPTEVEPEVIEVWCEDLVPEYGPYFYIYDGRGSIAPIDEAYGKELVRGLKRRKPRS